MRSAAEMYNNTLVRFSKASELMIGPAHFDKFNSVLRSHLVKQRLNAVKLKFLPGSLGDPERLKYYQGLFTAQLGMLKFETMQGVEMPVGLFLREGLTLIVVTGSIKQGCPSFIHEMAAAYGAYDHEDWYTKPVSEIVFLMHKMSVVLSDWGRSMLVYSVSGLAVYDASQDNNVVVAEFRKPESCMVRFDGQVREAIRLGWSGIDGTVEYLRVSPWVIGFKAVKEDVEYDVYIQRHALQRLDERLGLVTGLLHQTIFELLKVGDLSYFRNGPSSLVRFSLFGKKLGYLVCGLFEDKIVIRTFLFVTNDGTPEGKKLSELTSLQRLDKKYLEIDSLSGFLGMNIAGDPVLSEVFREAGCADLLDLEDIKMYYMDDIRERDLGMLLKYMMGAGEVVEELV